MDKSELIQFLIEEAEYTEREVANMTNTELLDHCWSTTGFVDGQKTLRVL